MPETIREIDVINDLADCVREVYRNHAARGLKTDDAKEAAAADLGITPRRVQAFLSAELHGVSPAEAARIQSGHVSNLRAHVEWLKNMAGQIARRVAEMEGAT